MKNSNLNNDKKENKLLTNTSLILGLLSTVLTIFIATSNYSINKEISKIQAKNSEIRLKLDSMSLKNLNYDTESRVIVEIAVYNAREFASNYIEQKISVEWPDIKMRDQFEKYIEKWNTGNNLMAWDPNKGLYLQQVVGIRLTNIGKTIASNLRIEVMQRDFDSVNGNLNVPYYEISTDNSNWVKKQIKLNDLIHSDIEKSNIRTQTLIPIVHVAGSNMYFGRVFVPIKIFWYDERLNTEKSVGIDITNDSMIKSKLASAVLGKSKRFGE